MNAATAQLPATQQPPKAALVAGGAIAAIIPRTIEEVFRLANAYAAAGLAPKGMDTPEKITIAILAGAELGLPPNQSVQSFAVINGRPTLWGDSLIAIVRAHGFTVEEWFDDEDNPTKAFCKVTRPDNAQVIERQFSTEDAKRAGLLGKQGPWQTSQKRMIQMRARGFACRDGAADVLRGFRLREEEMDYQPIRDVTPTTERPGIKARLEAAKGIAPQQAEAEVIEQGEAPATEIVAETPAISEPSNETAKSYVAPDGQVQDAEIEELQIKTGTELLKEKIAERAEEAAADDDADPTFALSPDDDPVDDGDDPFDPIEWAATTAGYIEACNDKPTLDALYQEWSQAGHFEALKAADRSLHADVVGRFNARGKEIKAAGARG